MVTRLLLVVGLCLGLFAPPTAGMAEHCRDHGVAHHSDQGPPEHQGGHRAPVSTNGEHCPPVECLAATHCTVTQGMAPTSVMAAHAMVVTGILPEGVPFLAGRDLEPPTPPPNRHS